ncbi:MAG: hypothetical protein MT490_19605 [Sphingomonas sp.]|uniref:DUF6771 family protein n=1 Tax=Sphingomonas sp. TaxID=28214 RepID=UPI0022741838|nr:DUF6771 family protein [Sphingomonas sp.]MCX8478002.1 hypothetical protein [Sphingomonas sp.]
MTRIDTDTLGAIEEAPLAYRQGLTAPSPRERLRAVDALAGWIGAQLAPPPSYNDRQLTLPIDSGLV